MKALHITAWETLYETWETRKVRNLTFYAKPNKLVGLGIGRTLQHEDGLQLLGVWALLEALASLAPQEYRGWLVRNGKPLSCREIAYLLRIPEPPVEKAIKHFLSPEIGWLEEREWPPPPQDQNGKEQGNLRGISGESPGELAGDGRKQEKPRGKSARGSRKDQRGTIKTERENKTGFGRPEDARRAQTTQFAALRARQRELEAVAEDERKPEEQVELDGVYGALRELQKKQAAGDFTPVRND